MRKKSYTIFYELILWIFISIESYIYIINKKKKHKTGRKSRRNVHSQALKYTLKLAKLNNTKITNSVRIYVSRYGIYRMGMRVQIKINYKTTHTNTWIKNDRILFLEVWNFL